MQFSGEEIVFQTNGVYTYNNFYIKKKKETWSYLKLYAQIISKWIINFNVNL